MIRAVLFDMGGTLDGEGHWLDRFAALYRCVGLDFSWSDLRRAFDSAERHAAADQSMKTAGLDAMVERHVGWQMAELGLEDAESRSRIITEFLAQVRNAAAESREVLRKLSEIGLQLGVVSNGCGNVAALCDDLGFSPFLAVQIDSAIVHVAKPDPRIFQIAAERLGLSSEAILMVGDSLERDIRPAKATGMLTAWLLPVAATTPPETAADLQLQTLSDLPNALSELAAASA